MHHEKIGFPLDDKERHIVIFTFLVALAIASLSPVMPIFIKKFVGSESNVGYFALTVTIFYLISALIVGKILEYKNKINYLRVSLASYAIIVLGLTIVNQFYHLLFIEFARAFFVAGSMIVLGLIVREYSNKNKLGFEEGLHYTASNIGWFVGPLIGGLLAGMLSIDYVFIFSAIIFFFMFILTSSIKERKVKISHAHSFENLRIFFSNKQLIFVYLLTSGMALWWIFVLTFIPLYMYNVGMNSSQIGIALAITVIPLICLEVITGKLADKRGSKWFMFIGFFVIALSAFVGFLYYSILDFYFICILLFFASLGASLIEPNVEAEFFRKTREKDEVILYPIFRTSMDFGKITGLLFSSSLLIFYGFKELFAMIAVLMLGFAIVGLYLKKN